MTCHTDAQYNNQKIHLPFLRRKPPYTSLSHREQLNQQKTGIFAPLRLEAEQFSGSCRSTHDNVCEAIYFGNLPHQKITRINHVMINRTAHIHLL